MAFLALDTSTEYLSLAAMDQDQIHALDIHVGQKHAENIIDVLRAFLQTHQLSMQQIKGIAYGQGPGSFTGLRIGCAIAQGLAFAQDIPLIGVSNLEALAVQSQSDFIISCIDARMGEVYLAMYEQRQGQLITRLPPLLCRPDSLPELPTLVSNAVWAGIGSGFQMYPEALTTHYAFSAFQADAFVRAREILSLALPRFAANQGVKAEQAGLIYLRNKVALTTAERQQ